MRARSAISSPWSCPPSYRDGCSSPRLSGRWCGTCPGGHGSREPGIRAEPARSRTGPSYIAGSVLYLDEANVSVEVAEISWIAGDHGLIASAGIDHHACVDWVVGASPATQDAGSLGVRFVKGRHGDVGQMQRSRKADLARAGPPRRSQGAGRDVDGQPGGVRLVEQGLHPPIGPLDGDQRSRIERHAWHQAIPRAWRAQRRSSSEGPPASAAISARSSARSS
jgi:hypothetical protein